MQNTHWVDRPNCNFGGSTSSNGKRCVARPWPWLSMAIVVVSLTYLSIPLRMAQAGDHPRLWLDPATLAGLQQRAAAATSEWTSLKATCDLYLSGSVEWPDGNDYPGGAGIGEGYQGDGYLHPLINIGLCYQTLKRTDPSQAQKALAMDGHTSSGLVLIIESSPVRVNCRPRWGAFHIGGRLELV